MSQDNLEWVKQKFTIFRTVFDKLWWRWWYCFAPNYQCRPPARS